MSVTTVAQEYGVLNAALPVKESTSLETAAKEDKEDNTSETGGDVVTISEEGRALAENRQVESTGQQEGETAEQQEGETGQGTQAQASAAGGGGAGATESTSSKEQLIERLERQIEKLEKEIEQLRGKAGSDEEAKAQLKTKESELLSLQAQLAELQTEDSGA